MRYIDISEEMLILPFKSGVRLSPPSYRTPMIDNTVKEIFSLPFHSYFLGKDGATVLSLNERNAIAFGCITTKDIIGKTPENFLNKMVARKIINHGLKVIKNEKYSIFDETLHRLSDDIALPAVSLKYPCYDKNNTVAGVFGFSVIINNYLQPSALINFFNFAQKLGFLNSSDQVFSQELILNGEINGIYLSLQEMNCLRLTLKGMTAKLIAKKLNISFRTVECHLSHVKLKLKVKSKSELIEKIMSSTFKGSII